MPNEYNHIDILKNFVSYSSKSKVTSEDWNALFTSLLVGYDNQGKALTALSNSDITILEELATKLNKKDIDAVLDLESTNPVQNKVIKAALDTLKEDIQKVILEKGIVIDSDFIEDSANPVESRAIKSALDLKLDKADYISVSATADDATQTYLKSLKIGDTIYLIPEVAPGGGSGLTEDQAAKLNAILLNNGIYNYRTKDGDYLPLEKVTSTGSNYGLMKLGSSDNGLTITDSGNLALRAGTAKDVQNQSAFRLPVMMNMIGLAVQQGLVNPNRAPESSGMRPVWSPEAQAAARATLGIIDTGNGSGSGLTSSEKDKLDRIVINGDGNSVLTNKGEYKQLSKVNNKSLLDGEDITIGEITEEEKQKLSKIDINKTVREVFCGNGTYHRIGNINGMSLFDKDIDIPRIEVDAVLDPTSPNAIQNSTVTGALNDAIKIAIENDSPSFDFIHNLTLKTNMDNPILEFSTQNKNAVRISSLEDFVEYYNTEGNVVTGTYKVGEHGVTENIIGLGFVEGSLGSSGIVKKYLVVKTTEVNGEGSGAGHWVLPNPRQVFVEFNQSVTNPMVDRSYPFDEFGMYTCVFELDKYEESFTDKGSGNPTTYEIKETNITETITKDNFVDIIKTHELYVTDIVNNSWYGRKFNGYVITPSGKVEYVTASFSTDGEDNLRLYFTYSRNSKGNFLFTQVYDVTEREVNIPLADDVTKIIGTDTTLTKEGVPADAKATGDKLKEVEDQLKQAGGSGPKIYLHTFTCNVDDDSMPEPLEGWFYSIIEQPFLEVEGTIIRTPIHSLEHMRSILGNICVWNAMLQPPLKTFTWGADEFYAFDAKSLISNFIEISTEVSDVYSV